LTTNAARGNLNTFLSTMEQPMSSEPIDLLIAIDTTGSMYPCLTQVRQLVSSTVDRLFRDIPNIRVGMLAHGDYCDAPRTITRLALSNDRRGIVDFVRTVPPTDGGDFAECYEFVLHEARGLNWAAGSQKAMVMIGDAIPHNAYEMQNVKNLDWRNELKLLLQAGVHVHAVQALNRRVATPFWEEVAKTTGGHHLKLEQFSYVTEMLIALAYHQADKQAGQERWVPQYEQEIEKSGRMTRALAEVFDSIQSRKGNKARRKQYQKTSREKGLTPVQPGRFQALDVYMDGDIRSFVEDRGLQFRAGRGFYELTKSVQVQDHKEVILENRATGDMYTGRDARSLLGLPAEGTVSISSRVVPSEFRAYIQSTSFNRKLLRGTRFLYEVGDL
jgi:hypothetical protein